MDSWRLALGTLTAIPTRPPRSVQRGTARAAMLLAPIAVVPLGILVALVLLAGRSLGLSLLPVAALAVGALALGSRALHLDGLSDTTDGLTSSYDRERSLAVMKSGAAGPAGVVAIVLVLAVQIAAVASVGGLSRGPWLVAFLVCASRASLVLACTAGVPAARADGLAVSCAGSVPRLAALLVWVLLLAASWGVSSWVGLDAWRLPAALVAGAVVTAVLLLRCVRRFGGVTGDVFGAGIELCLAAMLLAAT